MEGRIPRRSRRQQARAAAAATNLTPEVPPPAYEARPETPSERLLTEPEVVITLSSSTSTLSEAGKEEREALKSDSDDLVIRDAIEHLEEFGEISSSTPPAATAENPLTECLICFSPHQPEPAIPVQAHYIEMSRGQVELVQQGRLQIGFEDGRDTLLAIEEHPQYCVCVCNDCLQVGNLLPHTCRYKHLRAQRSHSH